MTTNVLDLSVGIAVTDSRWSAMSNKWFMFLDDANFEKIVASGPYVAVFSGDSWLIQQWKDWMYSGRGKTTPPIERQGCTLAVTVTDVPLGVVLFERGQQFIEETARFAGSGAFHAYDHWKRHADPFGAVSFAISADMFSGGTVKYFRFDTGENNLCDTIRLPELRQRLRKEGWMIDMETNTPPVRISETLKDAESLRAAVESVERGETSLIAPDPAMYIPWTADEKYRFVRLMTRIKEEIFKNSTHSLG
jgi:hypothetical protein